MRPACAARGSHEMHELSSPPEAMAGIEAVETAAPEASPGARGAASAGWPWCTNG